MSHPILIFIPTYNERENVERLCQQLLALELSADIVFLDDNSPDGTGAILAGLSQKHANVKVLHRTGKLGIGSAHKTGIQYAYEHNYEWLVTMDADFSHTPSDILRFLEYRESHNVVVGSRYMNKRSLDGWNVMRRVLTLTGHVFTKFLLRMPYDATGALRLYKLRTIPQKIFDSVVSNGYSFFFESLYAIYINGFEIKEVSIVLPARTYGHSKMSLWEAFKSLKRLISIFYSVVLNNNRYKLSVEELSKLKKEQAAGWDMYWRKKRSTGRALYDKIAEFYRCNIIKPSLNYFSRKYFIPGAGILHAGCGSGQVDVDLSSSYKITAMDISAPALNLYRESNPRNLSVVQGDISHIPFENASFEGVYNLGVMEHFTEKEIKQILSEFDRVLRPGGKVVLFWPPEFGLSVIFLKAVHGVLNNIFKKNVTLYPPEVTRVRSKTFVKELCEGSGFRMVDYYFGPRDLFTQTVIVLEKDQSI